MNVYFPVSRRRTVVYNDDEMPESCLQFSALERCSLCPRSCGANRRGGELGYCRTGAGFSVAAVVLHRGEEPVLSGGNGICNVFFSHCNLQCVYCQNHQISRNSVRRERWETDREAVVARIVEHLDRGTKRVGFVSTSHCLPQMVALIHSLRGRKPKPVFVMNTNAYDRVESLRALAPLVDVYLPDLKYLEEDLAGRYSEAPHYPEVARDALKEMFRQKGAEIDLDDDGSIRSGLIVRHLVLPGHVENSKRCLRFLAEELSPSVHLSLMAQYHPTPAVAGHPRLGRPLSPEEYEEVRAEAERLGFHRGWWQELDSRESYRPDFDRDNIFGD